MKLDLSNRRLTSLDGIDLSGVTELDCSYNKLTSLPDLPALEELVCHANQLTSLPDLPALKKLFCHHNQLTSLPHLPSSLIVLCCSYNQLTSLSDLSNQVDLEILECSENQLTELPDLPWSLKNTGRPWSLKDWDKEKLRQHNKKRADLGMDKVDILPDKETWDKVAEAHLIWQYRIGGEKWAKACSSLT